MRPFSALFIALLVSHQTALPAPRQSSDPHAGATQSVQHKASSKDAPAAKPPPPLDPAAAPADQGHGSRKDESNKPEQSVKITEVPPVTVRTGKGDIFYVVFSALLLIVSGLQAWLLCRTLIFVRRQSHEMTRQRRYMRFQWKSMQEQVGKMEEQLTEMERQTAATREAADAALLNAEAVMRGERAWLLVEDITANAIDFIRHPHFSFRVVNYGRTPAQVQGYRAYCQISASDEIPDDRSFMDGSGGRGDDPIVPPHGEPLKISSTDMWPPFAIEPTQEEVEKIAANPPELYLWACGYVSYWDVFGKDAQEVKDLKITPFAMVYRGAPQTKLMRPTFPFLNRPT
jgi:hypothetical protein